MSSIKRILGNRFDLWIPLQKKTHTAGGVVTEPFDVRSCHSVRASLNPKGGHSKVYTVGHGLEITNEGTVLHIIENGSVLTGVYGVTVEVVEHDGDRRRDMKCGVIEIVSCSDNMTYDDLATFYEGDVWLDMTVFEIAKGDKGDKGDPGIGIPTGGTTGQLLAKKTNTNYDTEWQDPYDDTQVRTLIQQTADNFANYYTKSETYSQSQVDQLLRTQREGQYVPVNALPTASAETMFKIYLVPSSDPQTQNVKDEYITIDNGSEATTRYTWEKIGSTDVDLSGYSTTEEMNAAIAAALQGKQDTLVSGTNIKTINNQSILGSGNITIQGGGSSVQSDWNQTDTEADDYIKNKPTIPTITFRTWSD